MNHQHILGFERPLFPRAFLPVTHKLLLLSVDVLVVNVLRGNTEQTTDLQFVHKPSAVVLPPDSTGSTSHMDELVLCVKFLVAALPATVGFIDGLWFWFPILLVQVVSAVQKTQKRVLMKHKSKRLMKFSLKTMCM